MRVSHSSQHRYKLWDLNRLLSKGYWGRILQGNAAWAVSTPQPSANIRNLWRCMSTTLYMFIVWSLIPGVIVS